MEKGDVMTFEQPAELNRFLCQPRPKGTALSWFWQDTRLFSPFLLLVCVSALGIRWSEGIALLPGLIEVLPGIVFLALIFHGAKRLEDRSKRSLLGWSDDRRQRKLLIYDDGLEFTGSRKIRWNRIQHFQIEPLGSGNEFEKLTVRYGLSFGGRPSHWSMIFAEAASSAALLSELQKQQKAKTLKFTVDILKAPAPPRAAPSAAELWLASVSLIIFFQSLPMLFVGAFARLDRAADIDTLEALPRFCMALWLWFGRGIDPAQFSLATGIILSAFAAGCFWRFCVLADRRRNL